MTREHYPDNEIWANEAAEIDAPDTALYAEAYESGPGKIPPRAGVHNKLFNRDNNMLQHIEQNGIPRWDARTAYPINGHALGSDGVIYRSLTADNTNNDPATDSVNWSRIVGELPVPTTGDVAKIPRVNGSEDGYELVGRASEAEAIAGTDPDKYMTPATTRATHERRTQSLAGHPDIFSGSLVVSKSPTMVSVSISDLEIEGTTPLITLENVLEINEAAPAVAATHCLGSVFFTVEVNGRDITLTARDASLSAVNIPISPAAGISITYPRGP